MPLRRFVPVPSLEGRLCLVTGAASGIGRATARAAARAGARLVITDVNDAALQSVAAQLGDAAALARALDIADVDAVRSLADETHAELGSVDVPMNIAGIATWGSVDRLSRDQWRRTVDVNLMGPIHVVESFVPAVNTPIVDAVDIAGVNRDAFHASPATGRFIRHAKSPDYVAARILDGITCNRYLVYTSADVHLLHLMQRVTPHAYAGVMRAMNNLFVRQMGKVAESGPRAHAAR